jgi:hypothetical protein
MPDVEKVCKRPLQREKCRRNRVDLSLCFEGNDQHNEVRENQDGKKQISENGNKNILDPQ